MVKIPIKLKEKQICYIAKYAITKGEYFLLMRDTSNALKAGTFTPDDNVTITVDPDELLKIHAGLGERQEYLCSGVHRGIKEALLPQIAILANPEETADEDVVASAQYVAAQLTARNADIDNWETNETAQGRAILLS
jgi:hypothetical protein